MPVARPSRFSQSPWGAILEQRVEAILIEQKRGREAADHHETWELLPINRFDNRCERAVAG